jgi:hypothetical protein
MNLFGMRIRPKGTKGEREKEGDRKNTRTQLKKKKRETGTRSHGKKLQLNST